jgi:hypothetical protein
MGKKWEGRIETKKPPLRRLNQGLNGEGSAGYVLGPAESVLDPARGVLGPGKGVLVRLYYFSW